MIYHPDSRQRGLLEAAAEARRRVRELNAQATRFEREHRHDAVANCYRHARALEDLAIWCELEANTYVGASGVLIGS